MTSGTVVGAIEVAKMQSFIKEEIELLEKMAEPIAANLYNVRANLKTNQLLIESRKQAEELAFQEQELKKINNELIQKSELLEASEEELKYQQEELKKVNLILEEKAKLLEEKNHAIEEARKNITAKASQLEQSNKYKSAFLANMSHELRTPLNSILILAKLLAEDKKNNLNEKQREHATVIHKSGSDLLMLINDILDLSKIEAGKLDLQFEKIPAEEIIEDINSLFIELANENKINLLSGKFNQPIIRDMTSFLNQEPTIIKTGVPAQLMLNRPDIKQAEHEMNAAGLDVKVARAEFLPELGFESELGYSAFKPGLLFSTPESIMFSLFGKLTGPVFNRVALKAEYANANARQIQSLYNYQNSILNGYAEVSNQLNAVKNLDKIYSLKSKQVATLNSSIDIAHDLFLSARADYLEVLTAQKEALLSKLELNEVRKNKFNATINLYRALGGGWK
jgi:hypothetical protein